jgi:hypothetical protein
VPLGTIFMVSALPVLVSGIACIALERVVNRRSHSEGAPETSLVTL